MTDDIPLEADDLLISVYLDTSALLDMLATIEDGFTLVERVTSGQSSGLSSERSVAGEISSPGILNFFKVGLSGKLGRTKTEGANESSEAELTHTYGSLLNRLRRYLVADNLVDSGSPSTYEVGSFVEFTGVVRPNPFTASFQQLQRMLGFYEIARDGWQAPNGWHAKGWRKPGTAALARQRPAARDEGDDRLLRAVDEGRRARGNQHCRFRARRWWLLGGADLVRRLPAGSLDVRAAESGVPGPGKGRSTPSIGVA